MDKRNYKGLKALYSLYETVVYKGPKALLSFYETMTIYKGQKALFVTAQIFGGHFFFFFFFFIQEFSVLLLYIPKIHQTILF